MTPLSDDQRSAILGVARKLIEEPMSIAELSNPGPVGLDTGYEFESGGKKIRVIAKVGESRQDAIVRVKKRHGV